MKVLRKRELNLMELDFLLKLENLKNSFSIDELESSFSKPSIRKIRSTQKLIEYDINWKKKINKKIQNALLNCKNSFILKGSKDAGNLLSVFLG